MMDKPVLLTISGPYGANCELLMNALVEEYHYAVLNGFTVDMEVNNYEKIDRRVFEKRLERGDVFQFTQFEDNNSVIGYRRQDLDDALLDDRAVKIMRPRVVEQMRDGFAEEQSFTMLSVYVTASSKTLRRRLEDTCDAEEFERKMKANKVMFESQCRIRYDHEILHLDEDNLHEVIRKLREELDI